MDERRTPTDPPRQPRHPVDPAVRADAIAEKAGDLDAKARNRARNRKALASVGLAHWLPVRPIDARLRQRPAGRAPRPATNGRSRGSRRGSRQATGSGSRDDPDPEPDRLAASVARPRGRLTAPPRLPFDVIFGMIAGGEPEFTAGRENSHRRPRGYAEWRPQARTRALLRDVQEILGASADYLPLTIRQIFYRLVAAYGYPKDERGYWRLCEHLGRARRARLIDFDAIRDDGVVTARRDYYASPADFWDATGRRVNGYRRDRQAGQPVRVELWCEAAGMLEQLARVAERYSVPVYSAGGFVSLTGVRGIAARALERDCPTVLLHVGDLDRQGEDIFEAMADDAAAFVEADRIIGTQRIEAVRVALTAAQVALYGLPTAPPKRTKTKSKKKWTGGTCQLEALPPDDLAKIVEAAIRDHLDLDRWGEQVEAEESDRTALLRALPTGEVT